MSTRNIRIWEMNEGKITSLKIDNAIFPLIEPFNYDPIEGDADQINNPVDVANAFMKLFDLKRIHEVGNFHCMNLRDVDDVVASVSGVDIKKSALKTLYVIFKDRSFASDDAYEKTRGKITPFGVVTIKAHLDYLKAKGFVKTWQHCHDGKNITLYQFIVPYERLDLEEKTEDLKEAHRDEEMGGFDTIEDTRIAKLKGYNFSSDLIIRDKNGTRIVEYKLKTIYITVKRELGVEWFSIRDIETVLKGVPGYSAPVIRACMSYLVTRRYAASVAKPPNQKILYTFLVPASEWRFDNKPVESHNPTCCAQNNEFGPDVIIKTPSVKVDFDSEEVKNRRMLEMQTARGEA